MRNPITSMREPTKPLRVRRRVGRESAGRMRAGTATALLVALVAVMSRPASAAAYVECGDPAGPSHNVTAVGVSCGDARAFARKAAQQGVTHSGAIALAGWRVYDARVRRVGGQYDVRATRE